LSEETKKKETELEDKDLEQVAGGTDEASPRFETIKGGTLAPNKTIT
jgi:hypothetical protein